MLLIFRQLIENMKKIICYSMLRCTVFKNKYLEHLYINPSGILTDFCLPADIFSVRLQVRGKILIRLRYFLKCKGICTGYMTLMPVWVCILCPYML